MKGWRLYALLLGLCRSVPAGVADRDSDRIGHVRADPEPDAVVERCA